MTCPLCNHPESRPSWLGSTYYLEREFCYFECLSCGSLYCNPMPDAEVLLRMYGPEYGDSFAADPIGEESRDSRRVLELLEKCGGGTFVDYGCGGGGLLAEAARGNWRAIGVEFDEEVVAEIRRKTGLEALTPREIETLNGLSIDILHLGDVIEHLTALDSQMTGIVRLVKPGGLLVAQGPLEANPNLFTLAVRLGRTFRKGRRTEMAPYHVLLATARGQRRLFARFGLQELEFITSEVAWPAPARLSPGDWKRPRALGLYGLRRMSQAVSAVGGGQWGNRYFYVGRRGF
jgi:SAM-dependent methyltransferase